MASDAVPDSVKAPCPACKLGKVLLPCFVDGSPKEKTCSVCRGVGWLYLSKEELVEQISDLRKALSGALSFQTKQQRALAAKLLTPPAPRSKA